MSLAPGAEAGLVPVPQELAAVAQLVFTFVFAPAPPIQYRLAAEADLTDENKKRHNESNVNEIIVFRLLFDVKSFDVDINLCTIIHSNDSKKT